MKRKASVTGWDIAIACLVFYGVVGLLVLSLFSMAQEIGNQELFLSIEEWAIFFGFIINPIGMLLSFVIAVIFLIRIFQQRDILWFGLFMLAIAGSFYVSAALFAVIASVYYFQVYRKQT